MIVDCVKNFMNMCPFLNGRLKINCLGSDFGSCSIEQSACDSVVKKYCDGGALKQARFVLGMRVRYGETGSFNAEAAVLAEKISAWIAEMNASGRLPVLDDEKMAAERIEVTSEAELSESIADGARLQLRFRLLYRQEM